MSKRRIVVTRRDLDEGRSGPWCPIELAMIRQGIPIDHVGSLTYRFRVMRDDPLRLGPVLPLPERAVQFVALYDAGVPISVTPIIFYMEVPDA